MITPPAFRARTAELLREAAATDEGQAVGAVLTYGRRQLEREGRRDDEPRP